MCPDCRRQLPVTRPFPSSFSFSFLFSLFLFLATSQSHIHTHRLTIIYLQSHGSTIIHSLTIIHPYQDLHEHTNDHKNTSRITYIYIYIGQCYSIPRVRNIIPYPSTPTRATAARSTRWAPRVSVGSGFSSTTCGSPHHWFAPPRAVHHITFFLHPVRCIASRFFYSDELYFTFLATVHFVLLPAAAESKI
jgi:hypothetical protein